MDEPNVVSGVADDAKKDKRPFGAFRRTRDERSVTSGGSSASQARPGKRSRRGATATSHSELGEKLIAGVPARIMRPRLVFISCLIAICAFGLLMVYSASSVEALKEEGSSWHYVFRQAIFMVIGFSAFAVIGTRKIIPWQAFRTRFVTSVWWAVVALLVIVLAVGAGGETWGASRWIPLGFFNLQPAELAKPAVIVYAANILAAYYDDGTLDTSSFLFYLLLCVGVPAVLIFAEPDLGTTIIIVATVFAMAYICGISYRLIAGAFVLMVLAGIILAVASPYRFARLLVFLDPWSDPYGDGFQATVAIMAFASGGPFGRGIGNATMKYYYLPEAHNDYILAIIGEELGFVGMAIFVAVFLAMIAAGFYIARRSPTLHGQLVAAGCSFVLLIQFIIDSFGILGLLPMTGKPLPFVSYGGSSVLTSLILAGFIFRVSVESNVQTSADRRRASFHVMAAGNVEEDSGVGDPMPRGRGGLRVYEGGAPSLPDRPRGPRPRGARNVRASERMPRPGGYQRVDLGGGASERLRSRDARPRVDYGGIAGNPRPRRSGESGRGDGRGRTGRSRYDR